MKGTGRTIPLIVILILIGVVTFTSGLQCPSCGYIEHKWQVSLLGFPQDKFDAYGNSSCRSGHSIPLVECTEDMRIATSQIVPISPKVYLGDYRPEFPVKYHQPNKTRYGCEVTEASGSYAGHYYSMTSRSCTFVPKAQGRGRECARKGQRWKLIVTLPWFMRLVVDEDNFKSRVCLCFEDKCRADPDYSSAGYIGENVGLWVSMATIFLFSIF